ncbi:recombinase family protein [Tissierella praeacuta]|uniref:recombinase family protein n=1 Tax=Tissierella praeacuta TaxID=43131 RepID=UPI001053E471|nr:recombinase family protein [Tissierella praeacuta]TCU71549.1 recombinase-like zinc beta ribbon protein [Tissierella praeacuta]
MNIYGYSRISRDEDKENYDAIITQNKIIQGYSIGEIGYPVLKIFEDDNMSGYTFNRDGLNKLKKLIEAGKVDILLTKDLSRIGRHNAKTLLFLEYLEEYNVRLILIHDNYDSNKDDDDIIGIKTWYNERYIKDISRKIRANLNTKQKQGGLITKVPYGYIRNPENKHRLIVDDEAAIIVKRIFKLYLDGYGGRQIANILNDEKIDTPSKYAYNKTGKKISGNIADKWTGTHVMRIIKNDVYIGNLRCRKTQRKKINDNSSRLEESEHIVYENYHEAIISTEDFELAKKIIKNRIENDVKGTRTKNSKINLFIGFLRCADCGGGFTKVNKKRSLPSYICTNNHHHGSSFCSSHRISEEQLKQIVLDKLELMKKYIEKSLDKIDIEISNLTNFNQNYDMAIKKYMLKITDKKMEIKNYSRQLAQSIISEDIAKDMIEESSNQLKQMEFQLEELINIQETNKSMKEKAISSLDIINEIIESGDLTRRDLETLIKKITIKQVSKPKPGMKPILNIDIEWDVFINSIHNIMQLYNENTLPHGNHSGDFPVLFSNNGYARMSFFTNKFKPEDVIDKSVIIHLNPDDYRSQPAGNSGKRIACGVIYPS